MPRITKNPDIRRQELIDIALKQFIEQGYEKTSIRSIVKAADGEIGMFYHYFASKEEIFNAVLEQYNTAFIEQLKKLAESSKTLAFEKLLDLALSGLDKKIGEYSNMQPSIKVNAQMLTILHHQTLLAIQPVFREIIEDYTLRGEITLPNVDIENLTNFLLFGMSAIIHDKKTTNMNTKVKSIHTLFKQILNVGGEHNG